MWASGPSHDADNFITRVQFISKFITIISGYYIIIL
jgi:hypothetical protein